MAAQKGARRGRGRKGATQFRSPTVAHPQTGSAVTPLTAYAVERTVAAVRQDSSAGAGLANLAGGWEGSEELMSLVILQRRR